MKSNNNTLLFEDPRNVFDAGIGQDDSINIQRWAYASAGLFLDFFGVLPVSGDVFYLEWHIQFI